MQEKKVRSRLAVSDPLAPVRVSPVRVNGSAVSHAGIEILNDKGKWECINIHSSEYNLVPNAEADMVVRDILEESGLSWTRVKEVWTGRYWARLFRSDTRFDDTEVGEVLSLGLRVENSYDGSCQFRLVLMAYVLSCSNGLVIPKHFSSYRMRHLTSNEFDISEAILEIQHGFEQVRDLIPSINRLSGIPLSVELLSRVARDTDLPDRDWGHITRKLGDAHSAWDLMQAITHQLSHHGKGRATILTEERVGDYFHSLAASAA